MMPKGLYEPELLVFQVFTGSYFVFAYALFVSGLTVHLVAEKEKKIKDGMLMMGLRSSVHRCSGSHLVLLHVLVVLS
jgi:ATP-binding cassette subfamily A (ABC1) protein 5